MKTMILDSIEHVLVREPGGWITLRQPTPDLNSETACSLLQAAAKKYPAPLRYARLPTGVVLLGEVLDGETGSVERAQDQLCRWLNGESGSANVPEDEWIESLLTEHAPGWSRRDDAWLAPPGAETSTELAVRAVQGGLQLEAILVSPPDADETCRAALAEFLVRSQAAMRLARIEFGAAGACLVSRCEIDSLDAGFVHSLNSVRAASQRLSREAQALLDPVLARAYLEVVAAPGIGQ